MTETFNLTAIVRDMKKEAGALRSVDSDAFDLRIEHLVNIGGLFNQIVLHEHEGKADMGISTIYKKHEKVLKPIMPQTVMVNEAHVLYLAGAAKRKTALTKYRKVGAGKDNLDSLGQPKLQTRLFASCIVADRDNRWLDNGTIKKVGGRSKTKKQQVAEAAAKVEELAEEWGEAFDFRYFVDEEFEALRAAVRAEENRRKLGGKVLVA